LEDGPKLPKEFAALEILNLNIVDENPGYFWDHLLICGYPELKRITAKVSSYGYAEMGLEIDICISFLRKASNLESVTII